ncbi:GIY-YIG nuclease family protein [Galbibacter sp. BG1]|uniref:GIY-YIG nuclease family protein n=1 Tax=Galbibacter sp. BG1 TaxID=1170699 RepID=UPI0015BD795C|nr:GIY-YIG nuclease family protein [Galbibacter sp. BG1]QLE00127.1 GIY-YIG nuclease family protein [Galbibacter sp. BG1]
MKNYYVYMLECSDNSIYTGLTNNLERRINEHNQGLDKTSYTFKRRPVNLIFYQSFIQFQQAERFEKKLKKWRRNKKRALAKEDFNSLKLFSECKNDTNSKNNKL